VGRIGAGILDTSWVGMEVDPFAGRDTGRLFFAPVETLTGQGLALSPFELHPNPPGMDFALTSDCLTCHTTDRLSRLPSAARGPDGDQIFPANALGAQAFESLSPLTCEACHGDPARHLEIVRGGGFSNRGEGLGLPRLGSLAAGEQRDVCARCHLQGDVRLELGSPPHRESPLAGQIPVLVAARPVADFRFVSQLERLAESACFRGAPQMTCTTCHLPHAGVAAQGIESFDRACASCHEHCSRPDSLRVEEVLGRPGRSVRGCVDCHVLRDQPFDLPHIVTADHRIARHLPTPLGERPHRQFADPEGPLRLYEDGRLTAALATPQGTRWRRGVEAMGEASLGRWEEAARGFASWQAMATGQAPGAQVSPAVSPLELSPLEEQPLFHHLRGLSLQATGDVDGALAAYSQALSLSPYRADSLLARARLLFELEDFEGVVRDTEILVTAYPRSEAPWDLRAFLALRLGNPAMAASALETSTRLWPSNPQAWRDLGRLRLAAGQAELAEGAFRRARALAPSLPGLDEPPARPTSGATPARP
jgi:hypothetical protein